MRARFALVLAFSVIAGPAAIRADSRASRPAFYVIVHPESSMAKASRDLLTDVFLKRTTRWSNDEVIRPVDLGARAPGREEFSQDVLGRSVSAVKSYWQQLVFSGRGVPPPELDSDEAVISYVRSHTGAIGYVSGAAAVEGVKVVQVE